MPRIFCLMRDRSLIRVPEEESATFRHRVSGPHLVGEKDGPDGLFRLHEVESGNGDTGVHFEHSAEPTVRLRATGSDGEPLIYIDGIRVAGRGVLGEISPDRVERVEIIKGPAAVALYGSAASAGVVQIFLKEASEPRE